MSNIFWTSDTHFYHSAIIKHNVRPFGSVEEMNEILIENWNSVVKGNDTIYHLGDFSFGNKENTSKIFNRLKGKKHICMGNHDRNQTKSLGWSGSYDDTKIKIGNQTIFMSHYSHFSWNMSHYGSIFLFGHAHSNGNIWQRPNSIDVGVDNWNYRPVSYEELLVLFDKVNSNQDVFLWRGKTDGSNIEYITAHDVEKIARS